MIYVLTGFTITGHDLVGSPYEPLNNRLSDIYRAASIISGKFQSRMRLTPTLCIMTTN